MRKIVIIFIIVILISVAGYIAFRFNSNRYLKKYEHLKEPQISSMKDQKMIEIQLTGDPKINAGKVFGRLFAAYYKIKNNHNKVTAPRARWPLAVDVPKETWVGFYGLPVSDSVTELPKQKEQPQLQLVNWEYGTVAEILHIGPYSTEKATIDKLKKFITDNGYGIVGDHEEEYLKGPGFWPTNPKHYHMIIRYRISKR